MVHISIVEQLDGKAADWIEKVSYAQYSVPVRSRAFR
jgi:4-carboxymuconolactone decarboxylase